MLACWASAGTRPSRRRFGPDIGRSRLLWARYPFLWHWAVPTVPGEWIAFIYFSYQVSSCRLWRGHIGHLIVGGRIRHVNNGSRITLRQAAIPALYDLAPLPFATLMVIPVLLLLVADGDRLDPLISWINGALELEHSFGTMLLILSLLVWMAHWPAVGCAG